MPENGIIQVSGSSLVLPDAVEFIDEVPKTSVGKFSKRTLRDKFAGYRISSEP